MKLFISWSGEFSKKVAECLSVWIPTIIQTVDVFYSPDDIAKGENWSSRLSDELEQSNFGIVCLTPENVLAPWVHFEAGALSKTASSRVSAIMLGVSPSDVKGPLARLQNTAFNRDDFHRLFLSINSSHENPLKQSVLDHAFDNSWEKLERDISAIIKKYSSASSASEKSKRDGHSGTNDAIQEILSIVRTLDNNLSTLSRDSSILALDDLDIVALRESRESSPTRIVVVECPKDSIDSVLPVLYKYSRSTPGAEELYKDSLSFKGTCALVIDRDQISALTTELQKFGATLAS